MINKIDLNSLKSLCCTHSVSGDTNNIIAELEKRLRKKGIKTRVNGYGVLLFGNLDNPRVFVSAHVDEIGFQVIKKNTDNTFQVAKSGHIDAVMLNNSVVYVQTDAGIVHGTFFPVKELGDNKPENFTEIRLDTTDNAKVEIGDFGSYKREFFQEGNKIMATGLDNKICVEMILKLIEEKPELLNDVLFGFMTEEETTYDCIIGVANQYQPEYGIVLDMLPVHQKSAAKVEVLPEIGKGPGILLAMSSYHLHQSLREKVKKLKTSFQWSYLDIDFPPEPQMLQRNGTTKALNIFIPMLGWHNSLYSMDIRDFIQMKRLVLELTSKLL